MTKLSVTFLGNLNQDRPAQRSVLPALAHSAAGLGCELDVRCINPLDTTPRIQPSDAFFVGTGAPDEPTANILRHIQYAREHNVPCIGTCGGSQRMIMEFAQNVLRLENIEHAELDPEAQDPLFTPLACSLKGQRAPIELIEHSQMRHWYGQNTVEEEHYCAYGLNEQYLPAIEQAGLKVAGRSLDGEIRALELTGHPFFLATAYVPQVSSSPKAPHLLITAWLNAAISHRQTVNGKHVRENAKGIAYN